MLSEDQSCLSACQGTNYWTLPRQVCKEEKPEEPIVFLHGIGIGLVDLSLSLDHTGACRDMLLLARALDQAEI